MAMDGLALFEAFTGFKPLGKAVERTARLHGLRKPASLKGTAFMPYITAV
jgi:hypothetical protein